MNKYICAYDPISTFNIVSTVSLNSQKNLIVGSISMTIGIPKKTELMAPPLFSECNREIEKFIPLQDLTETN